MTRQIRSAAPMPPSRTARRRAGLLAVSAAAVLGLSACSTQSEAATQLPYQPGDGIAVTSGPVQVQDFVLVGNGDGNWRLAGNAYNSGSEATTVTFAPSPDATAGPIQGASGAEVKLAPGQQLNLVDEVFEIKGFANKPGFVVRIDVTTPKGGTTTAMVPLMPPLTYYSTVTIPPAPAAPAPTTEATSTGTVAPTGTATDTPTGTATTTAP